MSFMNLISAPIPNPTVIAIKTTTATVGRIAARFIIGTTLKSKGNTLRKVKAVTIPSVFKTIIVIWRTRCLSKAIETACPTIERINVVFRMGSTRLRSWVRIGYIFHLMTLSTVSRE
jgi:hypothetical protein